MEGSRSDRPGLLTKSGSLFSLAERSSHEISALFLEREGRAMAGSGQVGDLVPDVSY